MTVELSIYVTDQSPTCTLALARLTRLLARYEDADYRLAVRNVRVEPLRPDEPRIVMLPTLVIRGRTQARMVATFDDTSAVETALDAAGLALRSRSAP